MAQLFSVSMKSLFSENNPMCNDSFLIKDYVIQIFILTSCIHITHTILLLLSWICKYLLAFAFLKAIFYVCGLLALISRRYKVSRFIASLSLIFHFCNPRVPPYTPLLFLIIPLKATKDHDAYIKHVWLGGAGKLNSVKVTMKSESFFFKALTIYCMNFDHTMKSTRNRNHILKKPFALAYRI